MAPFHFGKSLSGDPHPFGKNCLGFIVLNSELAETVSQALTDRKLLLIDEIHI